MQTPAQQSVAILPQNIGRVAVVVSRFNSEICEGLLRGATKVLHELGFAKNQYEIFWVPGAFEIPLVAQTLANKGFAGVVALGCVIRGDTPHFDYVCQAAAQGVLQAGLSTGKPVSFGVITVNTVEQAKARSADDDFNKGKEATLALLETIAILKSI